MSARMMLCDGRGLGAFRWRKIRGMPSWRDRALAAEKAVVYLRRELQALKAERELDRFEMGVEEDAFWPCGHLRPQGQERCTRC